MCLSEVGGCDNSVCTAPANIESIDISIAVAHLSSLPSRISQKVVEDFAEFENWFFDF